MLEKSKPLEIGDIRVNTNCLAGLMQGIDPNTVPNGHEVNGEGVQFPYGSMPLEKILSREELTAEIIEFQPGQEMEIPEDVLFVGTSNVTLGGKNINLRPRHELSYAREYKNWTVMIYNDARTHAVTRTSIGRMSHTLVFIRAREGTEAPKDDDPTVIEFQGSTATQSSQAAPPAEDPEALAA